MSKLFVVGTPIGNLQDLSPRAIEVLSTVSFIACEDTRQTMKLLQVFHIHTPLIACHMHNEHFRGEQLAERMLAENVDAALVTDAGMPCISDPGYLFVRECAMREIEILSVPGCCAAPSAISVSGMDAREWTFYGFLPREKKELRDKLKAIGREERLAVIHESPYRILELLTMIQDVLPQSEVSVSCDLTKLHELTLRGSVETVLKQMQSNPKVEKGEYCLVLKPAKASEDVTPESQELPIEWLILKHMLDGESLRDAQESVQKSGIKRNAVKQAAIHIKNKLEEAFL